MKEQKAKTELRKMLGSFSPGSVLMILGEVFGEYAEEAQEIGSKGMAENFREAEATMMVVGHGLDAILPKPRMS